MLAAQEEMRFKSRVKVAVSNKGSCICPADLAEH